MFLYRVTACLLAMSTTSALASETGKSCPAVAGWQIAKEQKPSPVPYVERISNTAVQLGAGWWRWNGNRISEAELIRYLRATARLNPVPITLVTFSPKSTATRSRCCNGGSGRPPVAGAV